MKTLILAGAALTALVTTPAVAQQTNDAFTGPRVEATVGLGDVRGDFEKDNVSYTLSAGVDGAISDRTTLGFDVGVTDVHDDNRVLGAGVRLGYALNPSALAYARAGVASVGIPGNNAEGYTLGGGLQFNLGHGVYGTTEYRFSDFDRGLGDSHSVQAGLGLRF